MNFAKLLNEKKIEKVEKTDFTSELAEKDLEFAKKGMETENYSRVMAVAYEAVLRVGNKLMNFLGYRAIGKEHHKNVFLFLGEIDVEQDLVDYFNMIRVKRNNFVYRDVENISREEAEEIIEKAGELVYKIRTYVHKIRTGGNE